MITPQQVTALTAQAARAATYPAYDVDGNLLEGWQLNLLGDPVYVGTELGTRGIGIYGQSVSSLVLTGYIKPASLSLITSPALVSIVLDSPGVWTGLNGVNGLLEYLSSADLQNTAQIQLMIGAYEGLLQAGVFFGDESAKLQATFVQPAARYGVDLVIKWINGQVDSNTASVLTEYARQAQYAIDFMESNSSAKLTIPEIPGYSDTTIRQDLDQAVTDIAANDKIPNLNFGGAPAVAVVVPVVSDEDGKFRFAPGNPEA